MTGVLVSFGVKCIVCFKIHLEHVNIQNFFSKQVLNVLPF